MGVYTPAVRPAGKQRASEDAFDPNCYRNVGGRKGQPTPLGRCILTLRECSGHFVRRILSLFMGDAMHPATIALFIHANDLSAIN